MAFPAALSRARAREATNTPSSVLLQAADSVRSAKNLSHAPSVAGAPSALASTSGEDVGQAIPDECEGHAWEATGDKGLQPSPARTMSAEAAV